MRLGQLARKYGVSKKEIITYLKEIDPSLHSLGQNSKLDQQTVMLIAQEFDDPEGLFQDQVQDQEQEQEQIQDQDQIQTQEQPPETIPPQPQQEGLSIETDKLLEMLESEDEPVDLSKITLIKAPKRELDGLKVVGKIDLPEPRSRQKKEQQSAKDKEKSRPQLSDTEREQRRLKSKKRREEYHAREKKRREEKEKRQKKALNKAHYQQKLKQAKASQLKQRTKPNQKNIDTPMEEVPAPPKTWLGKLWKWWTT